jgi:hypothetical protein
VSSTRLNGQLSPKTPARGASYDGHYVRLEFTATAELPGGSSLRYPSSLNVAVEADGQYAFLVDSRVLEDTTARIQVRSPLGANLAAAALSDLLEQNRLRPIVVDPEQRLEIAPHPDRFKGQRQLLTVRALNRDGGRKIARRQVLILATPADAAVGSEAAPALVFSGRTDANGYVSGPYPRGRFTEAFAEVARVQTPLRLEDDGSFPLRVVFATTLPAGDTAAGAPSNGVTPPRAPDEDDLLNAPESFSTDLGVGRCVDFTAPNRTLEELPFYKIVRTTDPEIKGTHLEPPIKLPPDFGLWVKRLAFGQNTIDSTLKVRPAPDSGLELTTTTDALAATLQPRPPEPTPGTSIGRGRAAVGAAPTAPPLVAIERHGVREIAQWRAAVDTKSIETALTQTLPTLSAESLRTVLVDADEFTPISLMTAERLSSQQLLKDLLRVHRGQAAGRAPLDEQNPVDWDDTPSFYQATTIAHGHILQFRQVWKADGYSLGDLLHSIPLAPCQKKQIVTIDWDRREDATRTEDLTEREVLFANLVRDRDVKEMIDTALGESIDGGSTAKTYGGGGGLGFAIGPLVIGAAGGGGGADSEAWQDSSREISAQTMQELKDRIHQSAAAVRSQRATVVQTLGQGDRNRVTAEVIANHNHCHALTIQYFEVLRHFQVLEELAEVRECLFVPFLMSQYHDAKVLRWRDALSRTLLKRSLQPAFDAIERIQINYVGVDFPLGTFAEEPLEALEGELRVRITIARPRDPKTDELDYFEKVWPFWPRLIGGNPADVYDRFLANQQFKDIIFRDQLAPQIAEQFIAALHVVLIDEGGREVEANLDPTLASKYRAGATHIVTLADSGNTPPIARRSIVAVEIRTEHELPEHSQVIIEGATFRYNTRHLRHPLYQNDRVLEDLILGDPVFLSTARLSQEEERNPRAEDVDLRRRMLTHLNANLEYYHKAMWWTLDKERRFILLDGFVAPHSGGRSVASVVENDLIGIIGNSLVFPVVAGFQLDPRYRALRDTADPEKPPPTLFDLYAPLSPVPPRQISVPTKGVFAEAVMGACNSCEKIDESRFWRWSQSPCPDDPPRIAEVTVASRASATPNLTATDFPAALVNFQAIPQAPDPGGLSAALALLGRGDLFRDITGLTQNQRNALGALQSSLATAQAFGQEAVQLAHAQAAQRSIDQTLNSLEAAKKDGRLTGDAAREVSKAALKALVGQHGAPGKDASVVDSDAVQKALNAAGDAKKSTVTVKEESAGQQQTVEVVKEGPGAEGQVAPGIPTFDDAVSDFIDLPATLDGPDGSGNWRSALSVNELAPLFTLYMTNLSNLKNAAGTVVSKLHWQGVGLNGGFLRVHPTVPARFQAFGDLHVCYPADPARPEQLRASPTPYPVVLLIHGNHEGWRVNFTTVRPVDPPRTSPFTRPDGVTVDLPVVTADAAGQVDNHHGYEELQRELARHGIVSVSVNTNFATSLDSKVRMRADTAMRCLDLLRNAAENVRASRYFGRLDFTNVGVMGHSRGGDAAIDVFRLNEERRAQNETATTPLPVYRIRAVSVLAGTDQTEATTGTGKVELTSVDEDVSLFVLYGSQDGDVFTGAPFHHYDRAGCPKALVFARGCNHVRFNTQWGLVDPRFSPNTLAAKIQPADAHRLLLNQYVGGFFRLILNDDQTQEPMFDGTATNTAGAGGTVLPVAVQWQFGKKVLVVDDFESAGSLNNRTGSRDHNGAILSMRGTADDAVFRRPHETKALRFQLTTGGTFRLRERLGFLDFFSDYDVLTFRMTRGYANISSDAAIGPPAFPPLRITLRHGGAPVSVADIYRFNPLGRSTPDHQLLRYDGQTTDHNVTKLVMETYTVPLTAFTNLGGGPVDPNAIPEIFIEPTVTAPMDLFIDSLLLIKKR